MEIMETLREFERAQREGTIKGPGKKIVIEISCEFYSDPEKHPFVNMILDELAKQADLQDLVVNAFKVAEEFEIKYPEDAKRIIGLSILKMK